MSNSSILNDGELSKEVDPPRDSSFLPAFAYHNLTPYFDLVLRYTCREDTFKRALILQAKVQPHHSILDVGCGTGTLMFLVKSQHPEVTGIYGIDPDPAILELAKAKSRALQQSGSNPLQFVRGFADALPFADATFDRVFSSLVFHHLQPNIKRKAMVEILRVLKPCGEFHLADWGAAVSDSRSSESGVVATLESIFNRLLFFPVQILDGFETTSENINGQMTTIMKEAGFQNVQETARYLTIFGHISLYRASAPSRN